MEFYYESGKAVNVKAGVAMNAKIEKGRLMGDLCLVFFF